MLVVNLISAPSVQDVCWLTDNDGIERINYIIYDVSDHTCKRLIDGVVQETIKAMRPHYLTKWTARGILSLGLDGNKIITEYGDVIVESRICGVNLSLTHMAVRCTSTLYIYELAELKLIRTISTGEASFCMTSPAAFSIRVGGVSLVYSCIGDEICRLNRRGVFWHDGELLYVYNTSKHTVVRNDRYKYRLKRIMDGYVKYQPPYLHLIARDSGLIITLRVREENN